MTRLVHLLAVSLLLAAQAWPGIRPSFHVQLLAWDSTDIAFVNEAEQPGVFVVEEVLKGTLPPGERIRLADMKPFQSASARIVREWPGDSSQKVIKAIETQRLMVFLKRVPGSLRPAQDFGGMQVSFAWLESGDAYAYYQVINPGPTVLVKLTSEQELRQTATEISSERASFDSAALLPDKGQRSAALGTFLVSKNHLARFAAMDRLKKCACEKDALPGLRAILAEDARLPVHRYAIAAIAEIGGHEVGGELLQRLRLELRFWKTVGSRLGPEWWSQTAPDGAVLRSHYEVTTELVRALRNVGQPAVLLVRELRDYWHTADQLGSPSGLPELTRECEYTLALTGQAD